MDESERIKRLLAREKELTLEGYNLIAGIDEAGRGPLAGPVIAAACILPADFELPGLDDSKKLTAKKRDYLALQIKDQAVAFSLGCAASWEIDLLNILMASKLAMKRALERLPVKPQYVLVDGRDELNISLPQEAVVGGDGLCASIAAASILAKVARDEVMVEMQKIYPGYGFDQHKGYGTKSHFAALAAIGPCPIHRKSFSPVKEMLKAYTEELG